MSNQNKQSIKAPAKTIKEVLHSKEQQIIEQAELAAEITNDYLTVKEYITRRTEDMQLTVRQQQRLEKYEFIYNQLISGKYIEREIIDMVSSRYDIQKRMALIYLNDTKELFGTAFNINKAFELKVQLELNRVEMQKASLRGDLKAYAMLEKNRINITKLLPEPEAESHEDYEGHVVIPVFDPTLLGLSPLNKHDVARLLEDIQKEYGGNLGLKEPEEADFTEDKEVDDEK